MTQLLSITAAAEALDCSRGHISGLIAAGHQRAVEIKAKGSRSKTRIRVEDLDAFIESRTRIARGGGAGHRTLWKTSDALAGSAAPWCA